MSEIHIQPCELCGSNEWLVSHGYDIVRVTNELVRCKCGKRADGIAARAIVQREIYTEETGALQPDGTWKFGEPDEQGAMTEVLHSLIHCRTCVEDIYTASREPVSVLLEYKIDGSDEWEIECLLCRRASNLFYGNPAFIRRWDFKSFVRLMPLVNHRHGDKEV